MDIGPHASCSSAARSTASSGRSRTAISDASRRAVAPRLVSGGWRESMTKPRRQASCALVPADAPSADDPTLPAILEFQWPSTAIVNAPDSALGARHRLDRRQHGLRMVAAMGLIPVDQVVTARGIVVSQSPTILVQPLETAIVRSIDVREGQAVKAGELLARLDPTFAAADLGALQAQVASLQAEVARLAGRGRRQAIHLYRAAIPNGAAGRDLRPPQGRVRCQGRELRQRHRRARRRRSRAPDPMPPATASASASRRASRTMRKQLETMQVGSRLNTLAATDSRVEMERALANARADRRRARSATRPR